VLNIKISFPGHGLDQNISQFVGNDNNVYDNKKFWINSEIKDCDFWFIFEDLNKFDRNVTSVDKKNLIYLSAETSWSDEYYFRKSKIEFLQQFSQIYVYGLKFPDNLFKNKVIKDLPFLPWMINANHGDSYLAPNDRDLNFFKNTNIIKKTKNLSIICSDKRDTEFHKNRYDFVVQLKEHFGDELDWFGNGVNEIASKWDGISNYKYHICLENISRDYLITEKLYDSFLGLSYPIYYGAPNINKFFRPDSYSEIDIFDIDKSTKIIEEIISTDPYEKLLPKILESKNLVCTDYNLFDRISKIVDTLIEKNPSKETITLKSKGHYEVTTGEVKVNKKRIFYRKIKQNIKNILNLYHI
jgi:hypothetical protein